MAFAHPSTEGRGTRRGWSRKRQLVTGHWDWVSSHSPSGVRFYILWAICTFLRSALFAVAAAAFFTFLSLSFLFYFTACVSPLYVSVCVCASASAVCGCVLIVVAASGSVSYLSLFKLNLSAAGK